MSCSSFFQRACINKKDSPPAGVETSFSAARPPSGMEPRGATAPRVSTQVVGEPTPGPSLCECLKISSRS